MASDWQAAERAFDHPVIGMSTMPELFDVAATRHADRPAQMYKGGVYDRSLTPDVVPTAPDGEFATLSYEEMQSIVRNLAAGLRELGVTAGQRVAIFAETRMEWAQSDFAVLAAGGVVTTVYASSSERQVRYLLEDPGARGVLVGSADQLERVLAVEADLDLDFVVAFDDLRDEADASRVDVYTLSDVHDLGAKRFDAGDYEAWLEERTPEDLCSLIYTSGTT